MITIHQSFDKANGRVRARSTRRRRHYVGFVMALYNAVSVRRPTVRLWFVSWPASSGSRAVWTVRYSVFGYVGYSRQSFELCQLLVEELWDTWCCLKIVFLDDVCCPRGTGEVSSESGSFKGSSLLFFSGVLWCGFSYPHLVLSPVVLWVHSYPGCSMVLCRVLWSLAVVPGSLCMIPLRYLSQSGLWFHLGILFRIIMSIRVAISSFWSRQGEASLSKSEGATYGG